MIQILDELVQLVISGFPSYLTPLETRLRKDKVGLKVKVTLRSPI